MNRHAQVAIISGLFPWPSGRCTRDCSARARMRSSKFILPSFNRAHTHVAGSSSQYLENLCDYLYDSLRPRILHEPKLEVLCELCTVISAMMALDADGRVGDDDDEEEERDYFPNDAALASARGSVGTLQLQQQQSSAPKPLGRLRFSVLLETILQDTQTRLVFRGQAVIQSEVLYYSPTRDDLLYPDKLELHKGKQLSLWTDEERRLEGEVTGFRAPREDAQVSWYPTLQRTVWVLSKLNTHVNVSSLVWEERPHGR